MGRKWPSDIIFSVSEFPYSGWTGLMVMPVRVNFLFRGGKEHLVTPSSASGLGVSLIFNTQVLLLSCPCPHCPSSPFHSIKTKRCFIAMSLLHYCSKLARLSPLGEGKKQKPQIIFLTFPPPSPITAQQCLNTFGDKNNLQKWSRNYIMNCPNTRHTVGFLVNQIFLRKLHEF